MEVPEGTGWVLEAVQVPAMQMAMVMKMFRIEGVEGEQKGEEGVM